MGSRRKSLNRNIIKQPKLKKKLRTLHLLWMKWNEKQNQTNIRESMKTEKRQTNGRNPMPYKKLRKVLKPLEPTSLVT